MVQGSALLLGGVRFIQPEWHQLSAVSGVTSLKEFNTGTRQEFFKKCDDGEFDDVLVVYRGNDAGKVSGQVDEEFVQHLPASVKYICQNGAGYDGVNVAALTKRGIHFSNSPQAVDDATADTGIFLMLGALRQASIPLTVLRQGQWGKAALPMAHDPQGKVLGILGMGSIGRNMAAKARAFGMTIQYHNRTRLAPDLEAGAKYVDFETLLGTSDVFSLNLNLSVETVRIIGKKELAMMKHGVTIVNTARGKLIDEAALVEALEDGDRIWSAGLDVFEDEPQVHPGLIANPRVFLLPHIGTLTFETRRAMELVVLDNAKSAFHTGRLLNRVTEQKDMPYQ